MLNKAAIHHDIAFIHGAVAGFEGRAMTVIPGKTTCFRCMTRGTIAEEKIPVIGFAPAVIGSIQAGEVIKYLIGIGTLLTDTILRYDGLTNEFSTFTLKRNPQCEHCGDGQGKG